MTAKILVVDDIPANVKDMLEIKPVRWIEQVLAFALVKMPTPLIDDEPVAAKAEAVKADAGKGKAADNLPH